MIEFLWGTLVFIVRAVYVVLEVAGCIWDLFDLVRRATGTSNRVEVPADPKILSPAAQRALDEAEQRRIHAASGTVQAS